MADDGSAQSKNIWPMPKFAFKVEWDKNEMLFQEVSGLDVSTTPIEYRVGNSKVFAPVKMPGLLKYGDVTMKKGVFKGDNDIWKWFQQVKMNVIKRVPVTISLLDEAQKPTMVWKLVNAWPSKLTSTDLKATGNEVAIDTIVVTHEGLTIQNG
jgi:phage tail-like protein